MKKQTIVFSCLAILFLLSAFSGFSGGLVSGGVGCLVICGIFVFLAFRSNKAVTETNMEVPQTPNRFTPAQNKSSFSQSLHDNTANTDTAETPSSMPVLNFSASDITETVPFTPPISTEESTTTQPVTVPNVPNESKQFEYLEIKVVGVTFKNDKGPTRQTILRKIHFNDKPFDEYVELGLHEYEFDGKPAFGVYANNMQIGNIPADYVQFIIDNDARYEGICGINVYGGGRDENGYAISYGCKITLKYHKQTQVSSTPSPNEHSKSSLSQSLHDNTVNTDMAETPTAASVLITPAQRQSKYIFAPIKVAGVTFNNDDGSSRQLILRKLRFHDSPFNEYADIEIKQYEFKGQPAYGVYVNNMQIGNIPTDLIPFMQDNIRRIESISYIDVYGGGQKDGKPISYGCKITLRFLKDNPPINVPATLKIND